MKNQSIILGHFLAATLFIFLWDAPSVHAADERIAHLTSRVVSDRELEVSAKLLRWSNPKIIADLNNGISKDLYYYILLKKRMPFWYDEEMHSLTIRHTIKYEILKKQYSVSTRTGDQITKKTVGSIEELDHLISTIDRVRIKLSKRLRSRHTYYTSIKAEIRATRVPFYREYILFFIPALELDTPWANSAPFYAREATP